MDPILTSVVAAFVAGASAKAKDVGSEALSDAYDGLKKFIVRKLGKSGAVQSVEDEPESESAQATLVEALSKKADELQANSDLKELVESLERAITGLNATSTSGVGLIDIQTVRGKVNATVENLTATGRIKLGSVIGETGDATVKGLTAGGSPERPVEPKN